MFCSCMILTSSLFILDLTVAMGLCEETEISIEIIFRFNSCFNPYSAGTDFSRQNLTSVDVRF